EERAVDAVVRLVVVVGRVLDRRIGPQPRGRVGLGRGRHVDAVVVRVRNDAALLDGGCGDAVVDPVVVGGTAERDVVLLGEGGLEEAVDVVEERGAFRIWRAPEEVRAAALAARTVHLLQLRRPARKLDPEAVAVLQPATGPAALRGDHDRAVRRI